MIYLDELSKSVRREMFPPVTMVDINMEYNEKSENYTQRIDLVYALQKYNKYL